MENEKVILTAESPYSPDAVSLMKGLSDCLKAITGDGGNSSFSSEDVLSSRSLFVVARSQNGEAVGCGAFRPMSEATAEIKRMYAKKKGIGTGSKILACLEHQALLMGYRFIRLETRRVNTRAVLFYKRSGYRKIANYGRYESRPEAICFEKELEG